MGLRELNEIAAAENVVNAFMARASALNWGQWAVDHPGANDLLNRAMKAYLEYGDAQY